MLPSKRQDLSPQHVFLLGIDIIELPPTMQFLTLSAFVFIFYVGYGYYQELIFRLDGMQPFGWYLTLVQFGWYTVFALMESAVYSENLKRKIPFKIYVQLALYTVATMGFSTAAVGYLNYPTQVIFKCCKLIPVLIGGILIQGKRYGLLDLGAACLMSFGLILFSLADSQVSPNFDPRGYIMISCALVADAVIGNVQERYMKHYNASNKEVVLFSYSIGWVYIFAYLLLSGNFMDGFSFFWAHPYETYGYGLIFSLLGFLGVNIVLTLVRTTSALTAVTVTTLRKAVTIIVSFIFFSKPFSMGYVWGGVVVLAAIYLNLYNKNKNKWNESILSFWRSKVLGYQKFDSNKALNV